MTESNKDSGALAGAAGLALLLMIVLLPGCVREVDVEEAERASPAESTGAVDGPGSPELAADASVPNRAIADEAAAELDFNRAVLHLVGDAALGVERDPEQGLRLLERASAAGHARARSRLGVLLYEGAAGIAPDRERALTLLRDVVQDDDGSAAYVLAEYHLSQGGDESSPTRGLELLELAAEKGVADARHTLGAVLASGADGLVTVDLGSAYRWLSLAVEQGLRAAEDTRVAVARLMSSSDWDRAEVLLGRSLPEATRLTREQIRWAQGVFQRMGFYEGALDGIEGPGTRRAVLRFNELFGMPGSGSLSPELLEVLRIADARLNEIEGDLRQQARSDMRRLEDCQRRARSIPDPGAARAALLNCR
jgi:localization factor PodJL